MVRLPLGDMEGKMVRECHVFPCFRVPVFQCSNDTGALDIGTQKHRGTERGQAAVLFAIVLALMAIFTVGLLEYMTTNAQVQDAVAIADLAAHAGAMEITVRPSGEIYSTGEGAAIAERYFRMQAPSHVHFGGASCGLFQGRPGCRVTAMVQSTGYLLPRQWITVNAIGYLANGVTRGDQ